MKEDIWKAYSHGMAASMQEGSIPISSLLLRSYRQIGLNEVEVMLLLQLQQYASCEQNLFPTPEELADRMGTTIEVIEGILGRLMKNELLAIDDYEDEFAGVQAERYNWNGWLLKVAEWHSAQMRSSKKAEKKQALDRTAPAANLFSVFEQEFGRLLSPMECETISSWLDKDRYTEELIQFALKESVFAGKLSLRYIDRILIDWSRNRITNADEARAHSQKFHSGRT